MLVVGEGNLVSERVVKTDRVIDNQWLITDGLKGGERVIVEGLQKARAGITVHAVPLRDVAAAKDKG